MDNPSYIITGKDVYGDLGGLHATIRKATEFEPTGEFRPPRKGELFVSISAYKAFTGIMNAESDCAPDQPRIIMKRCARMKVTFTELRRAKMGEMIEAGTYYKNPLLEHGVSRANGGFRAHEELIIFSMEVTKKQ